jgi:hypothetical protein
MTRLKTLTARHAVAFLALFLVLGGSATAAIKLIDGKNIKKGTVTSKQVKDRSLLAKDFKAGQLPRGATGAQGPAGMNGAQGIAGATGPGGGAKGDTGAAGAKGDTGAAGADGADGTDGAKGDTGATGAKGDKGDTGANGTDGLKGADGAKGDTGAAGTNGTNGEDGARAPAMHSSTLHQGHPSYLGSLYPLPAADYLVALHATVNVGDFFPQQVDCTLSNYGYEALERASFTPARQSNSFLTISMLASVTLLRSGGDALRVSCEGFLGAATIQNSTLTATRVTLPDPTQ